MGVMMLEQPFAALRVNPAQTAFLNLEFECTDIGDVTLRECTDFGGVAYHEFWWGMLPRGQGLSRGVGLGLRRLPLAGADAEELDLPPIQLRVMSRNGQLMAIHVVSPSGPRMLSITTVMVTVLAPRSSVKLSRYTRSSSATAMIMGIAGVLGAGVAIAAVAHDSNDPTQETIRKCRAAGDTVLVSKCRVMCLKRSGGE